MKTTKFVILYSFLISIIPSLYGQVDTIQINKLFEMSFSDLMNQEVTTSSKFIQKSSEAASSIGVITADEIKNFGYRTLGEALNSQRGIYLSNDKNYLQVGSRGFSRPTDYNNRLIIMIDGHMMNEVVFGSAFMGNELAINLDNVEKIEIIRGPGASVYGSGAMLNIVNILMKKGSDVSGLSLSATIGSFGKNDLGLVYGKKLKNLDFSLSGKGGIYKGEEYFFNELNSPETNNGLSGETDWEKYIGFQSSVSINDFKLAGSFSGRSKGIPTGAFNTDLGGDTKTIDNRYYIEASYRKEINSNSSILLRSYFDDYNYYGLYESGGVNSFDDSKGRWGGAEIQYYLEAGNSNIITAGVEYKYVFRADYREWDSDTTYFDKNIPFSSFSLYVQDQVTILKNLHLTAGLRYDKYSIFGQAVSPRLALVYSYSENSSLKLLYSEAYRIPNFYESFYEAYNSHIANPDIKSERIRVQELVWSHKLNKALYGTLSLYHFSTFNLIDQHLHESDLTEFHNLGRASGYGLEYEFRYKQPVSSIQAFLNITLQRAIDQNTDLKLSNSPAFMAKSGLVLPATNYFNIVPEFFIETGRTTLAGNDTGNLFLFNLGINSAKFLKHFEASVKARNIFNRKYYSPGGYEHVQDVLVQDSRNIYLKLTAHF